MWICKEKIRKARQRTRLSKNQTRISTLPLRTLCEWRCQVLDSLHNTSRDMNQKGGDESWGFVGRFALWFFLWLRYSRCHTTFFHCSHFLGDTFLHSAPHGVQYFNAQLNWTYRISFVSVRETSVPCLLATLLSESAATRVQVSIGAGIERLQAKELKTTYCHMARNEGNGRNVVYQYM